MICSLQSPCASHLFRWTLYFGSHTACCSLRHIVVRMWLLKAACQTIFPLVWVLHLTANARNFWQKTSKCEIFPHMCFDKNGKSLAFNCSQQTSHKPAFLHILPCPLCLFIYPDLKQWAASNRQLSNSDLFHVGKPQNLRTFALAFLYKQQWWCT